MKQRNPSVALLLFTVAMTITGPAFGADSPPQPPPAKVVVEKVAMQSISENDSFLGLLYYDRTGSVSSEVAGLVLSISVREGDRVEAGTILVRLDTEILDQEIATLRTQMEHLTLSIEHTEKNFKRLEALYEREGVSEKDLDDARFAFEDARVAFQVAQRRLETLEIRQRKSTIKAPFAGVILEKRVEAGDWVSQGKPLVRIGDDSELYVRVPIAERLMRHVKVGAKIPVLVTAYDKKVTGTLMDIDPIADAQTKNVFAKVRIPPLTGIAENMSASVQVPTSDKRTLAMIPRDALIKYQGKDFVYTVKEGKAEILPVNIVSYLGDKVGADNPYFVAGMPVVVEGNERLRPDQPVTTVPAGKD